MKQLLQNYQSGELQLAEVPAPAPRSGGVLVDTETSLVSAGTEKLMIDLARKSLLGKAIARPDLVKKVIDKVKSDGLMEAYQQAMSRLDDPIPLGYSSCGTVRDVGQQGGDFEEGDRVACFGSGYASHAERVYVPKNLAVAVPDGVRADEAAFAAVGAISLHAVRTMEVSLGERVGVIGLGLLGLIAVQLLKTAGCEVLGVDPIGDRLQLAEEFGADRVARPSDDVASLARQFSDGHGLDAVAIYASTDSNQPLEQASEMARERATISVPGMVGLDIPRKVFYEKELDLVVSRSTGPGIYDPEYEEKGHDYPISYVRWTEERNMKWFLRLLESDRIDLDPLITHKFQIDEGPRAYELIMENHEPYIGVLLEYDPQEPDEDRKLVINTPEHTSSAGRVGAGLIGAGQYARGTLLPAIEEAGRSSSLRGVATTSGSSSKHAAEKFGFDYCTTDYRELLEDDGVDLVLIATRHHLHEKLVRESLEAGKHVFVEKPLCLNRDELETIIQTYNDARKNVLVGFNRRFSPFATEARKLYGPVEEPVVMQCRVNAGFVEKSSWVHDPEQGGGRIVGEICHFVDLLQYFSDSVPARVSAEKIDGAGGHMPERDNLSVQIKFENGSVGSIVYVASGDKSYPRERLEVFGESSVVEIDNFKWMKFLRGGTSEKKRNYLGIDRGHESEMETLFDAIEHGEALPVSFEEHVYTTLTTFEIEESLDRKGSPVSVDPAELEV